MTQQEIFAQAYWLAQKPAIRALNDIDRLDPTRMAAAVQLALAGEVIDHAIHGNGIDPLSTMELRKLDGYTWVTALLQPNIAVTPGNVVPNTPVYDPDHPPAGSIKVSTDIADYPPYDPPKPVVVPTAIPAKPNFHIPFGPGIYAAIYGDSSPDGKEYPGDLFLGEPAGVFVKHITDMLGGGKSAFWRVK